MVKSSFVVVSILIYLGSILVYFGSILIYLGSILIYFGSILNYLGSILLFSGNHGCVQSPFLGRKADALLAPNSPWGPWGAPQQPWLLFAASPP